MFRRSIFEFSRHVPRRRKNQIPSFLSCRKEFSTASRPPNGPGPTVKPPPPPPESTNTLSKGASNTLPKVVIAGLVVGLGALAVNQTGYLDQFLGEKQPSSSDSSKISDTHKEANDDKHILESVSDLAEPNSLRPDALQVEEDSSTEADATHIEASSEEKGYIPIQVEDKSDMTTSETPVLSEVKESLEQSQKSVKSKEQTIESETLSKGALDMKIPDTETTEINEEIHVTPTSTPASSVPEANDTSKGTSQHHITKDIPESALGNEEGLLSSLLDAYDLKDVDEITTPSSERETNVNKLVSKEEETTISKDGKLVLDFLQAIHAAEKSQAELDAHIFGEEKRMLKEKYEKELKDARARELFYAEEAAILDKELNKEKTKAALAIKSLQEKGEVKLRMELERKEVEAEVERKKIQELAKAELFAAIATEKASQIENMAEVNLNINALCLAFYARSEETRQTHSLHKLALGALAIEETLSRGLPVQKEIEALHTYLEGIDKDSLIDLVLSSLPDETRHSGTDTPLQLNHKFDALKGKLRHFSLIPPGGGGLLTHSVAHIASSLKVKQADQSGDSIESVINRVQNSLAEGKLAEAADILEEGVQGTQAAEIVGDWVQRARNRAISEQALTLLQSYATTVSFT